MLLGIDAGNHKSKTAGIHGVDSYKTNICNWFERDIHETFGPDDMEFTINSRKGYAGSIAEHEDEYGNGTRYGESKAHEETLIRVLLAIHRYKEKYEPNAKDIYLVTGQPLISHKEDEKNKIIRMLKGSHQYEVNGKIQNINIQDVKVTPEGSGAFWANPQPGLNRIIDVGSGTVNLATVSDFRHIHKSSGTMNIGMETMKNKTDLEGMARGIVQHTTKLKWNKNDRVMVCGGIANLIILHIRKHYPNAETLRAGDEKPVYANAIGFYNLAKGAWG